MTTVTNFHTITEGLTPSSLASSQKALDLLNELKVPSPKMEDWKYTKVNKLAKRNYIQKKETELIDTTRFIEPSLNAINIFVINGVFSPELSDKTDEITELDIIDIANLKNFTPFTQGKYHFFTVLNTAFFHNGIYIKVKKKQKVNRPIHIINILTQDNVIANNRLFIELEEFGEMEIIQSYVSNSATSTFSNCVGEYIVNKNASLTLTKIENEGKESSIISADYIVQKDYSTIQFNTITKRQDFARNNITVDVDGQYCTTLLNGVFTPEQKEHIDNQTQVNHLQPNCMSSEIYKGVLKDKSTGVFNGKVIVHPDAQKIEAYQKNNNVLLSETATMNAKPELEIFADDVKCSHGTTTGQFDEKAIFYLKARGISEQTAKEMLVEAFTSEVFDEIKNKKLVQWVTGKTE